MLDQAYSRRQFLGLAGGLALAAMSYEGDVANVCRDIVCHDTLLRFPTQPLPFSLLRAAFWNCQAASSQTIPSHSKTKKKDGNTTAW